jgi:hypothetical protein
MIEVSREEVHQAVDQLSDESLKGLWVFIGYLRHKQTHPGSAWFREMYEIFAPVREEAAHMSDEEINQIIDQAIAEARRAREA